MNLREVTVEITPPPCAWFDDCDCKCPLFSRSTPLDSIRWRPWHVSAPPRLPRPQPTSIFCSLLHCFVHRSLARSPVRPLAHPLEKQGKPVLIINNHKLEGKVASEPKPLLVLRKVTVPHREGDAETGGEGTVGGIRPQRVEYRIVGKVTGKTIFKTRPKPLIRKIGGGSSTTSR